METQDQGKETNMSLLAKEAFGNQYHGEESEEQETSEETEEEVETEETVDDETGSDTEFDEEETDDTESEEVAETEEEEGTISNFSELVEHQQWDPEWAKTLTVPVKVDGQEAEATIDDLVNSYQIQEAAEHRLDKVKEVARAQYQELESQKHALQEQFAIAADLIKQSEQVLDRDAASLDERMRKEDPAEYAARKEELRERREALDQMKREAGQKFNQQLQSHAQQTQQQTIQHLQQEHQVLVSKIPDWKDQKRADAEKGKLANYLVHEGFSEQDVMGVSDHRLILLARKAMLYDQGQGKRKTAEKKVAKAPKTLKSGATKPKEKIEREKVTKLQGRLRKSGSIEDAYALLKAKSGG